MNTLGDVLQRRQNQHVARAAWLAEIAKADHDDFDDQAVATKPQPAKQRTRTTPLMDQRGRYPRPLHGHRRGYKLHIQAGETPCTACQQAMDKRRQQQAAWIAQKRRGEV